MKRYSKVLVPGIIMVAGMIAGWVGSDFAMGEEQAKVLAAAVVILAGIFFAPKNAT